MNYFVSSAKKQLDAAARLIWREEVLLRASQASSEMITPISNLSEQEQQSRSLREDCALIVASGLFDAEFYLSEYPDLKETDLKPLEHYLKFGGRDGRRPGPIFNASQYLSTHPDVRVADMNPLVHFIRYGIVEDRDAELAGSLPYPSSWMDRGSTTDSQATLRSSLLGLITQAQLHLEAAAYREAHDFEELKRLHQNELERVATTAEQTELQIYIAKSSAQRAASHADRLALNLAQAEARHTSDVHDLSGKIEQVESALQATLAENHMLQMRLHEATERLRTAEAQS